MLLSSTANWHVTRWQELDILADLPIETLKDVDVAAMNQLKAL